MNPIGYYLDCDTAICAQCAKFKSWPHDDDVVRIYSDTEADTPTHCAECGDIIPHGLTKAGLDYVRDALAEDAAKVERTSWTTKDDVLASWAETYEIALMARDAELGRAGC